MKDSFLSTLENVESVVKSIKSLIKLNRGEYISKKNIKDSVTSLSRKWFEDVEPALKTFSINEEVIKKYRFQFDKLLELSLKQSRKNTYSLIIEGLLRDFRSDIIVPVVKCSSKKNEFSSLFGILEHVTEKEAEYLDEAIGCANTGFLRASIVMGWCAAVSRMHTLVEKNGFDKFNKASSDMKSSARYKRYAKSFSISSSNELRAQIFDNDLLWILEYLGLIDPNQHDRLSLCFTMRNNSAHPGDAPLTEPNVLSFYSDIDEILFKNEKFKV